MKEGKTGSSNTSSTSSGPERLAQLEGSFIHKLWSWKRELVDCVRTMDVNTTAQDCLNKAADAGLVPPTMAPPTTKGGANDGIEKGKTTPGFLDAWTQSTSTTPQKMEEVMSLSSVLLTEQLKKEAAKSFANASTAPTGGQADIEADKGKMSKFLEFYKSYRQRSVKSRMEKLKSMQASAADILQSTGATIDPMTSQSPAAMPPPSSSSSSSSSSVPSFSIAPSLPYPAFNPEVRERFSELVHKCMHEIEQLEDDVLRRNADYESIMSKLREMAIVDNPRIKRMKQEGGSASLPALDASEEGKDEQMGDGGETDGQMDTNTEARGEAIYLGRGEGRELPSLVEFCLRKCVALAEYLPALEGCLAEDLLHALLARVIEEDKLASHPHVLRNLLDSSMTSLSLSNCRHITDGCCEWIAERCHLLKRLDLSFCKGIAKGQSVSQIISSCSFLEAINLQGCVAVGDESVFEISMRLGARLQRLNLGYCMSVTDEALGGLLLRCPNLIELRLPGCVRISDSSMSYLEHVQGLLALDVSRCEGVTDATLSRLGDCCHALQEFRANDQGGKRCILQGNSLTYQQVANLGLAYKNRITDSGVYRLASGCKDLRVVELTGCDGVTGAAIDFLLGECIYLVELGLPSCKGIKRAARTGQENNRMEDVGEILSLAGGENLKSLNLSGCVNAEDGLLETISVACPNLEALYLSSCENVTDEGLAKVGRRCGANLVSLVLERCLGISDASLSAFLFSSRLTRLNLERCRGVTDNAMAKALRMCPSLEDVDFSLCDGIGDETILSLTKNCLNVKRLMLCDLPQLTESSVSAIAGLAALKELRLTHNMGGATAESIICIIESCREMTVLDLSNCTSINRLDTFFARLCVSLPFLEELYLRGWSQWKGEAFLGAGRRLKVLDIAWCNNVEDDALSMVSRETCPSLTALEMAYCKELSGVAVHNLVKRLLCSEEEGRDGQAVDRRLRSVNLRGCTKISILNLRYLTAMGLVVLR